MVASHIPRFYLPDDVLRSHHVALSFHLAWPPTHPRRKQTHPLFPLLRPSCPHTISPAILPWGVLLCTRFTLHPLPPPVSIPQLCLLFQVCQVRLALVSPITHQNLLTLFPLSDSRNDHRRCCSAHPKWRRKGRSDTRPTYSRRPVAPATAPASRISLSLRSFPTRLSLPAPASVCS
jgi:hypothetical protein